MQYEELFNCVINNFNDTDDEYYSDSDTSNSSSSDSESDSDILNANYGCKHYKRKCKIKSECCNKIYWCRLCHDEDIEENEKDFKKHHKLDRHATKYVICSICNTEQEINKFCVNCKTCFGKYYCKKCRLYDDIDKQQYHCNKCGICRVGKSVMEHCDTCNICRLKLDHECRNISNTPCPICYESIEYSVLAIIQMKCGHWIHRKCFNDYLLHDYKCPLCSKSVCDLTMYNEMMDRRIEGTVMPEEQDKDVQVLCNECEQMTNLKYHYIGHKCGHCGSYNTKLT